MSPNRCLSLGLLLSMGCTAGKGDTPGDGEDSRPDVTIDTGAYVDTSPIVVDDTGDSGGGSGDDTGGGGEPAVQSLALYPDGLTVHPGAVFSLRALATGADGAQEVVVAAYAVADPEVAQVDAMGTVTAVGVGQTTIQADYGGRSATVSLSVGGDGLLAVTAVDAVSGLPIADAKVKIGAGEATHYTNASGQVAVDVSDVAGGALVVSVYSGPYMPVTVWGTVSRSLTVPLYPDEVYFAENATIQGEMGFGGVADGSALEVVVGLVVPSFRYGPLMVEPDDLMVGARTITVYGVDAEVPENLTIEGHAEGYAASAPEGQGAVWSLAGPLAISEVTSSLDGTADAIALLERNLGVMSWGWSLTDPLVGGEISTLGVSPSQSLSRTVSVEQPPLSAGFAGTEAPLLMVGSWLAEVGMVTSGLGLGSASGGAASVRAAPPITSDTSQGEVAAMVAQVSGLGSGGPICSSWAPLLEDGETVLPALQTVPAITDFDPISHVFALQTDPRASYVRVLVESRDGTARIVYLNGGVQAGDLTDPGFPMSYGVTVWRLLALETTTNTFEGLVTRGDLLAETLASQAWTSAQATVTFQGRGATPPPRSVP